MSLPHKTRKPWTKPGFPLNSGSVWESNPQRALFKPATGFEDQGHHQMCKHSRTQENPRKPRLFQALLIVFALGGAVYYQLSGRSVSFPHREVRRETKPSRAHSLRRWFSRGAGLLEHLIQQPPTAAVPAGLPQPGQRPVASPLAPSPPVRTSKRRPPALSQAQAREYSCHGWKQMSPAGLDFPLPRSAKSRPYISPCLRISA
jgi:hypothetical protein